MDAIFANRLRAARLLAGYSLRQLSERLSVDISAQAISLYENGKRKPDSSIIVALSEALKVPIDFFFRNASIALPDIEFRKKSKLGRKHIEQIKEFVIDYLERYFEIELILNITSKFSNPLLSKRIGTVEDIESAASELRTSWDLGLGPISNIIEMLEGKGVKIIEIEADPAFDGLSTWVGSAPVIVVNKNSEIVRKRLTVVHELGHLLLEFDNATEGSTIEKYCNSFAGAFLLPAVSLKHFLGSSRKNISINELVEIKEYFGISVQAIAYRLVNAGIKQEAFIKNFFIFMNKEGLRDEKKFGVYIGEEQSRRFERLINKAAVEQIITFSKASQLQNKSIEEFRRGFEVVS